MKWIKAISRRNRKIGVFTTRAVGNMWTAYLFTIWSLLPSIIPRLTFIVQYVSQDIIQLVLLSVIMVGQDVASQLSEERHFAMLAKLDAKADEIKATVTEELAIVREENIALRQIVTGQADLMAEMEEAITDLHTIAAELHDRQIGGREHLQIRKKVNA